jgi:hypothetical protein
MGVKYVTTSAGVKFREDGEVGVGVDIFYVESGSDDAYKCRISRRVEVGRRGGLRRRNLIKS